MIIKANSLYVPLKDKSIQAIITSPPYWGLRNYDVPDIVFRDGWVGQLGQEPTIKQFMAHLMFVMDECWRVLKDDGVCFVNLGDTYSGSGGAGGDYNKDGLKVGQPKYKQGNSGIKPKSLCFVPERFAIACIDAGWIIRNKIIWYKPNSMPTSAKDRFSVQYEQIFMMVKQRKYYFDLDAVRQPHALKTLTTQGIPFKETDKGDSMGKIKSFNFSNSMKEHKMNPAGVNPGDMWNEDRNEKWVSVLGQRTNGFMRKGYSGYYDKDGKLLVNPNGKNPGDCWTITTQPYPEAHYATFPPKLVERMLLCSTKTGDIVLDPFGGSGTTGKVALEYRRKPILLDIGYHELQKERLKSVEQQKLF